MAYFVTKLNYQRHCLLYLSITIAFLLLGLTNATNKDAADLDNNATEKITTTTYISQPWKSSTEESRQNATAITITTMTTARANASLNTTTTEAPFFHKPKNMSDVKSILLALLRLFAQALMIFGGVIPYIPQYLLIKRTQNAEGFSNYVCLTLLVANILRIEFWFGKHFEIPLLIQSIVMILCMLIMLEIWTRVHARTMHQNFPSDQQSISASKEQLTEEVFVKKFTDFEVNYFWRWTKFTSYLQFLFLLTLVFSIITWIFIHNTIYIETIGFLAVFFEALLGMPQFIRNLRAKSTDGMSVKMVLLWASGDIFKTVYFVLRNAPKQFWICGILQISIDIAILCQVLVYSNKYRFFRQQ